MDIADILVLIITLAAVLYSIVNSILVAMNPEKYRKVVVRDDEDEGPSLQTLPQVPNTQPVVRSHEIPPQEKFKGEKFAFKTKMDEFRQKTSVEDRALSIDLRPGEELVSDAVRLGDTEISVIEHKRKALLDEIVKTVKSKKMLWISHEVVSPPIALRPFPLPWNK